MAQIHQFHTPPRPRRPFLSRDMLAWLTLGAGGLAAFIMLMVPGMRGLSTLIGLAVAVGGYMALYDRGHG